MEQNKIKYPQDATVELNLNSSINALRDLQTLLRTGSIDFTIDALGKLADRYEEIYREQNG